MLTLFLVLLTIKRGKGKGKGKNRGRGGNTNRGGYNNGDYQGYQEAANQGPPRQSGSGYNYSGCQRVRVITNLPNILTKINKGATMVKGDIMVIISSIKTDSRVEMIKGVQVIVVAITAALVEVMQIHLGAGIGNVSAVMGPLTISMGSAIGKITALQNWYAKYVVAHMSDRGVSRVISRATTILKVISKGAMDITHHNKEINFKEGDSEMVRGVQRILS